MLSKNEKIILSLIHHFNGKWTWYQMDRGAWMNGWSPSEEAHVFDQTKRLIEKGYVREEITPDRKDPVYWITENGLKTLEGRDDL